MNEFKKKVTELIVSGIAIFAFGIFVGYQLKYGAISSIQGYLFNAASESNNQTATSSNATSSNATSSNATSSNATSSNATSSNATSSNATSSNATSSNATSSNATSSNATSSNANITDNIIYLLQFDLANTEVEQGEKINVTLRTSGAYNSAASVVFASSNGATFTVQVQNIGNNPYIIIPNSALATTYSIKSIMIVGKNSDNTTFANQFTESDGYSNIFAKKLTITQKQTNNTVTKTLNLKNISLKSTTAKIGEKVYLNLETNEKLESLKLTFSSNEKKFTIYAKDLNSSDPYIEIPSTVETGTYTLISTILYTTENSKSYSIDGSNGTEKFAFNSKLEIKEEETETYIYNNENINAETIAKLYNAPTGTNITINADDNTIIDEELFNTIKGKNKQLTINYKENQIIFDGTSITNAKTIDASMTVNNISTNENINKLVSNGIVVNFQDNGNLPGKAIIRIKLEESLNNLLNDNVYVYIYNESTNNFSLVDTNAKKTADGYYEFTITHNSSYIMVNEELDNELISNENEENIVDFQKSDTALIILLIIGVLVIIIGALALTIPENKKSKNNEEKK